MSRIAGLTLLTAAVCVNCSLANAASSQPTTLPAGAQDAPPQAVPPSAGAVGVTAFWENDGNWSKLNGPSDRDYTAGGAMAFQWQAPWTDDLVGSIPSLNGEFDKDAPGTSFSMGVEVAMKMYTPSTIDDPDPLPDQRPYAGWLYTGFIAQRANRAASVPTFEHLELDLGTIGPSSGAANMQKWIHKSFDYTKPEGWKYQIRDEYMADFKYDRRWRTDLLGDSRQGQWCAQLIPSTEFTLGSSHINAGAGATLRAGWNLPDDFGPGRLAWIDDFTRPFAADGNHTGAYVFVRPAGHIVGHDSTIDGSYFQNSPVEGTSEVFTGELQFGVAVQFLRYWQISYSQTYTTAEFIGQPKIDSYGSMTLSMVYTW